jgi:hypothetical protein
MVPISKQSGNYIPLEIIIHRVAKGDMQGLQLTRANSQTTRQIDCHPRL